MAQSLHPRFFSKAKRICIWICSTSIISSIQSDLPLVDLDFRSKLILLKFQIDVTEWRAQIWCRALEAQAIRDIELARVTMHSAFRINSKNDSCRWLLWVFLSLYTVLNICNFHTGDTALLWHYQNGFIPMGPRSRTGIVIKHYNF